MSHPNPSYDENDIIDAQIDDMIAEKYEKLQCEVCEEMFPEEEMANNKRCQTCYEEFGMSWPDQV
jgi:formylmethanofuran dehydrogenase subunit E